MSRLGKWSQQRWGRLPRGAWLYLLGALLCAAVACWFFVRRTVIAYPPVHTFGVSDPAFFGSAHALADPFPVAGNKIELLHNGDEAFPSMLAAIRGARTSVNFEAFLFWSGKIGGEFRDALSAKAREGVPVRVLLDGLGSGRKLDNADVAAMKAAGCKFAYYHPTLSLRLDQINRRTHRRILVVDGKTGFTGGVGFADLWSGHAQSPEHWRDVHARLEGPLVAKLQAAFQAHWVKETEESLTGAAFFPALTPAGSLRAQVIAAHSFSVAAMPLLQAVAITAAERTVFVTNAYCTPSDEQVETLVAAARRGVDVRLLVPGPHNDQPLTKAAGRGAYGELLAGGVKIYEYQPTMIHTKTMVVDGLFSVFGSSNLDARSSQLNEELDVTVYDAEFGREMERVFRDDLKNARAYTLEEFRRRGVWERFVESVMSPFHSQL